MLAFLLLALTTIVLYFFLPNKLHISSAKYIHSNARVSAAFLLDSSNWKQWQPNIKNSNYQFNITNRTPFSALIRIKNGQENLDSELFLVIYTNDSTGVEWGTTITAGNSFWKKLNIYFEARSLKNEMNKTIEALDRFVSKTENVYGVAIEQTRFKDTFMISHETMLMHYPSAVETDSLVQLLKSEAESQTAIAVNHPMMFVEKIDSNYSVRVALPINKEIKSSKNFRFRFMIQGNTLKAKVIGDTKQIESAIEQMRLFISDNNMSSPAIPFQSMETIRSKEADSSKWVTYIYYPVM